MPAPKRINTETSMINKSARFSDIPRHAAFGMRVAILYAEQSSSGAHRKIRLSRTGTVIKIYWVKRRWEKWEPCCLPSGTFGIVPEWIIATTLGWGCSKLYKGNFIWGESVFDYLRWCLRTAIWKS